MIPIFVHGPTVLEHVVGVLGFLLLLAAGPVILVVFMLRIAWSALRDGLD